MEGGGRGNILDPAAAEFYPTAGQYALGHPQIYYTYPPPPPLAVALPVFHHQQPQQMEAAAAARGVVLSMVPRHVGEAEVRTGMEAFGGVWAVEMGALAAEGVVTVHFYDLRSAEAAVAKVREQHARQHAPIGYGVNPAAAAAGNWAAPWLWHPQVLGVDGRGTIAGQAVWAQFAAVSLDEPNQGSIVVLNPDPSVSLVTLREIFEPFGAVKEVREMPSKPQHKLVEFFDTRDAARALSELNGREIKGRRLLLEFNSLGSSQARSNYLRSAGHGHGHHDSPLPPRFLRGIRQPSRWTQASGASHKSSSSSSLHGASGEERTNTNRTPAAAVTRRSGSNSGRKNKSSGSSNYPSSSSQQQQQSGGGGGSSGGRRSWKNRSKSSSDLRFLFKEVESAESSESSCRDTRTTVMIKNIPNKYSQKLLLNMLDNHCIQCNEQIGEGADEPYSAYDFVYLPIDFNNKCNVGYGFVNLTSPEAAFRLYKAFHQQPWEVFNSRKICQVTYARLQGLEALEHFRNSKFACDNDEYMPVVFSPPRDGKQLTEPVPVVVGREQRLMDLAWMHSGAINLADEAAAQQAVDSGGASSTTTSTHAPSDNADGGDDDDNNDDVVMGMGGQGGGGGDATDAELSEAVLHLSCN